MRAMADALASITSKDVTLSLLNEKQAMERLLQQTIECCLFVNKYSRKSFEGKVKALSTIIHIDLFKERKLSTIVGRKLFEFTSFFVAFKDALDIGTSSLPVFVSSRVINSNDESSA